LASPLAFLEVSAEHLVRLVDEALCLFDTLPELALALFNFRRVSGATFSAIFIGRHRALTKLRDV
jgi:hypothetical protein